MVWAAMKVIRDPGGVQYPSGAAQFASSVTGSLTINCQIAYSFDRGDTWYPTRFPYADQPACGDPMVVAGRDGSFYVAIDAMGSWQTPNLPSGLATDRIAVARSRDGGRSFSEPTDAGTVVDRPFMRIDPANDYLYESSGGGINGYPRQVAVSKDHARTWSAPKAFGGNHMAVNHGVLAYAAQGGSPASGQLELHYSKDQAATFTTVPVPGATGGSGDWITADPTRAGAFALMQQVGNVLQVNVTRDLGKTWGRPVALTNSTSRMITKPWIDYGSTGVLGVMWKSTTADGNHFEVFLALSKDSGRTFAAPVRISSAPSEQAPITYLAGDDLSWVALDGDFAYVGWGDMRSGDLQAWFARYRLSASGGPTAAGPSGAGSGGHAHLPTTGTSQLAAAVALLLLASGAVLHRRRRPHR
jgi:LPXTG-motif cell wall-anchored protein